MRGIIAASCEGGWSELRSLMCSLTACNLSYHENGAETNQTEKDGLGTSHNHVSSIEPSPSDHTRCVPRLLHFPGS